jgi:transposase
MTIILVSMNSETQVAAVKPIIPIRPRPKPSSERAWREGRRLRAWQLHEQGWTQQRIAEALGVTQGAVSQWLKAVRTLGTTEALLRRPSPGAPARLNQSQLHQLDEWLRAAGGATALGFVGEVWTRSRVASLIESRFGVKYHPSHVGRILKKIGFSLQKPIKQANQRDEAAVEQWIKEEWPTRKKSGR